MVVVKQRRMSGEVGDAAPPSLLSSLVLGDGVAICKLQLRAPEISFKISVPFFYFFLRSSDNNNHLQLLSVKRTICN